VIIPSDLLWRKYHYQKLKLKESLSLLICVWVSLEKSTVSIMFLTVRPTIIKILLYLDNLGLSSKVPLLVVFHLQDTGGFMVLLPK
jgi:hypothetical protein